MRILAGFTLRQFAYSILAFVIAVALSVWMTARAGADATQSLTDGQLLTRIVAIPAAFATLTFGVTMALAARPIHAEAAPAEKPDSASARH